MEKIENIEKLNKKELLKLSILLDKKINEILKIKKEINEKLNGEKNIKIVLKININEKKQNKLPISIIQKSLDKNKIKYTKIMKKEELYNLLQKHKKVKFTYNMLKEDTNRKENERIYINDSDED